MVTDIKIILHNAIPPVLAYVSFVVDGCLLIHDVKLMRVNDKTFIAMPSTERRHRCPGCSKKIYAGSRFCAHCGIPTVSEVQKARHLYQDIIHPVTPSFRVALTDMIITEYNRIKAGRPAA